MKRLIAALALVLFCAVAFAGDALYEPGTYVAHPDGGGSEQDFPIAVPPAPYGIPAWIIVGGQQYHMVALEGGGCVYLRPGTNDGFEFDFVAMTWTYYDDGFAMFSGTYTEPD